MAYRLTAGEAPDAGIRRIACEQADQALAALGAAGHPQEAAWTVRKHCKKLRALLRLVRPALGDRTYAHENRCVRDAGRLLGEVRDAEVLTKTLASLRAHCGNGDLVHEEAFAAIVPVVARQARLAMDGEHGMDEAAAMLRAVRARIESWPVKGEGWNVFAEGLEAVYARGARLCDKAYETGGNEHFHDWRKQVKYLWLSLRILRPLWPRPLRALGREAGDLSELLGDDHDLTELIAALRAAGESGEIVSSLASQRSRDLRARARPAGLRLYAERPGRFTARLGRYWEALQVEQ